MKVNTARSRKYKPELLVAMFRKAAALRNDMVAAGFTDNGGAIHSAERILNILGCALIYPELNHINNLKHHPQAVFSIKALKLHRRGEKVLIEHVAPLRDLTRRSIARIDQNVSDEVFMAFVRRHYRLVLLSPEETKHLNKRNRSTIHSKRLYHAGIRLATRKDRA